MGSDQLINEILKDKAYYEGENGGLTLSGGDPLFQFNFALEVLQKAKKHKLHTCLETEAYCTKDKLEKVLPYVDLFYFDYKISDNKEHLKHTGKSKKS